MARSPTPAVATRYAASRPGPHQTLVQRCSNAGPASDVDRDRSRDELFSEPRAITLITRFEQRAHAVFGFYLKLFFLYNLLLSK